MAKIVVPGEFLATEEEYSKGFHTFYYDGCIHSCLFGNVLYDTKQRIISVDYRKAKDPMLKGDLVYAVIESVKENMVFVNIFFAFNNSKEKVVSVSKGRIFIADVSSSYVKNLKSCFKIGDIIKAKIKEITSFSVFLQTNESSLGVIKAFCSECRQPLRLFDNKLKCVTCGNTEERKLSNEYSKGVS